jgi:hypothetical protein
MDESKNVPVRKHHAIRAYMGSVNNTGLQILTLQKLFWF